MTDRTEQAAVQSATDRNHALAVKQMAELLRWRDGIAPAPGDDPSLGFVAPPTRRRRGGMTR